MLVASKFFANIRFFLLLYASFSNIVNDSFDNFHSFFFYFSFSILQVAKTSSVKDVIVQALAKNRKDSESDRKSPEDYVLVEEIDVLDRLVLHAIKAM